VQKKDFSSPKSNFPRKSLMSCKDKNYAKKNVPCQQKSTTTTNNNAGPANTIANPLPVSEQKMLLTF